MKKKLYSTIHLHWYSVVGSVFLLPFFFTLSADVIARVLQGDLFHYSRPLYYFLSQTPFYAYPMFLAWMLVLPIAAVLINLIPLLMKVSEKPALFTDQRFLLKNSVSIIIVGAGLAFLAIIFLHDVVPCIVNGVIFGGLQEFFPILKHCSNA